MVEEHLKNIKLLCRFEVNLYNLSPFDSAYWNTWTMTHYPPLTPILLISGTNFKLPDLHVDSDTDFKQNVSSKMFKYIPACKDILWKRWNLEYLLALRGDTITLMNKMH